MSEPALAAARHRVQAGPVARVGRVAVPEVVAGLTPFVEAGVLDAAEVHLAAVLARQAPGTPDAVLLAAALAARAPRLGHVCVELATVATTVAVDGVDPDELARLPWPDPVAWAAALASSALVAQDDPTVVTEPGDEVAPLVWDGTYLTLDRYARYERAVAQDLRARAADGARALVPAQQVEPLLDRFFGAEHPPARPSPSGSAPPAGSVTQLDLFSPPAAAPAAASGPDLQRAAARVALGRRLAVIAGGPGTGKTRTVARILAAAHEAAAAQGRDLQVALVAPTGKAAARLTEAVHHEVGQVRLTPEVEARLLTTEAGTIHRVLGPGDGIRFRHQADDPLPHDLVVVDETSMASLPLVARLLDAVRPDAHLVLVGDPDQLASVEAGAVLSELVRAAEAPGPSAGALAGAVVVLRRAHRFGGASAIAALADAVRAGQGDAALALLDDPTTPDVERVDPADAPAVALLERRLADTAEAVARAAAAGDPDAAMAAALDRKVLAATRRGPNGLARWQLRTEVALAARLPEVDTRLRWYVGRPVMVTRNDPLTGLFNGDAGILTAGTDGARVAFPGPGGCRWFEPTRLDELETWWATTIHKSQGSEVGHAVVALPEAPSPMLTRELLYTGITRARQRVTVVASEAALRAAVRRRVSRSSSLADLLARRSTPAG